VNNWIRWTNRHLGLMALVGGFCSATAGATWWLAKGGAAAFITSMMALSDAEIADTLVGLPDYRQRTEQTLAELSEGLRQVLDSLEVLRLQTEAVVEWAPDHSQRLTDAVGGCFAGENCQVYLRGRRTQSGAACTLKGARPRIVLPDGREFPVELVYGFEQLDLGTEFETIEVVISVPEFIEPGLVGVVVLTVYADCPFVSRGRDVYRETFRLLVEIKDRS